jgi:hypothetical protein
MLFVVNHYFNQVKQNSFAVTAHKFMGFGPKPAIISLHLSIFSKTEKYKHLEILDKPY